MPLTLILLLLKDELKNQAFWQSESFWAAAAAFGALLSAVAAFLTIRQASRVRRYEVQMRRAYLRVIPDQMNCAEDGLVRLPLKLVNIGGHPAADISGQILFINRDSRPPVMVDMPLNLANDFAQQAEYTFSIPGRVARGAVVPQQFILLALRYRDAILGSRFEQFYYFTWYGCPGGAASEVVSSWAASREEAEKFFDKEIREFRFATQQAGAALPPTARNNRLQKCQGCGAILDERIAECGGCGAETRAARMRRAALVCVVIITLLTAALLLSSLLR